MYHPLQDYLIAPEAPKLGDMITPVKATQNWTTGSGRKSSNRDVLVMNSTAQNAEENSPHIPCEISSINATVEVAPQDKAELMKRCTETPAKIFARMKAKVQRHYSAGHGPASDHVVSQEICGGFPSNPVTQYSQKNNASQETYVLALSPPQSPRKDAQPEETDLTQDSNSISLHKRPGRQHDTFNMESFMEPSALLDKEVPGQTLAQLPRKHITYVSISKNRNGGGIVFGERSISTDKENEEDLQADTSRSPESDPFGQSEFTEVVPRLPQLPHNLLDDPLLQLSPRVLIPRKKVSVFQSKQQVDIALDEETSVRGIHLRQWVVKLLNKDIVVDGIRV